MKCAKKEGIKKTKSTKKTKREREVSACHDEETLWDLWNRCNSWTPPQRVAFITQLNTFRPSPIPHPFLWSRCNRLTQIPLSSSSNELDMERNRRLRKSEQQ